jgi:hypothetical protein
MRLSLIPILLLGASLGMAQDVRINSSSGLSTPIAVLSVKNTATSDTGTISGRGKPAIYGFSEPTIDKGIGVEGIGADDGVYGVASGLPSVNGLDNTRVGVEGYAYGGWLNLGILGTVNTSSDYAGYFQGNVMVMGYVTTFSDSLLKTDIQPMPSALKKLMTLKPKSYRMATSKFPNSHLADGPQFGVLAQDLATVYPELVSEGPVFSGNPADASTTATKYKSVNYTGLIPILIKAVQEQQAEIDTLQQQIRVLKGQ